VLPNDGLVKRIFKDNKRQNINNNYYYLSITPEGSDKMQT